MTPGRQPTAEEWAAWHEREARRRQAEGMRRLFRAAAPGPGRAAGAAARISNILQHQDTE